MTFIKKIIKTSRDSGCRLREMRSTHDERFQTKLSTNPFKIKIEQEEKYQSFFGFGGAFTEAAAHTFFSLSAKSQDQILKAYFHPELGLNYELGRTHINSCDFSLGNYSSCDFPGDEKLNSFQVDRDKKWIFPLIKAANKMRGKPISMMCSPWSPPAWMKTNGEMNNGGKLKSEYYATWALFFVKYLKAYAREVGVSAWAITCQNEPEAVQIWDSCLFTAEEQKIFVRDHLGPLLKKNDLSDVKLLIFDHNKDHVYDYSKIILDDPKANQYVWGIAYHWYSGDEFENLEKTHNAFSDKHLVFSEGCIEGGVKVDSWKQGEFYAHHMIGDFNHWSAGWIDWNLILNQHGGPNHVGNYCDALIIANTEDDTILYRSAYYYTGHFSKYIKKGAIRLGLSSENEAVECVAFENPNGEVVLVILNQSDNNFPFEIELHGLDDRSVNLLEKHSIMTFVFGVK